ncbi:MAG: hypothetical protein QXQ64_06660 [Candidatus Bathyarchaeia archaeon]
MQEAVHLVTRFDNIPVELPGVFMEEVTWMVLKMNLRGCEVLELLLLKMRGCRSADKCREVTQKVLTLVKERKFKTLK